MSTPGEVVEPDAMDSADEPDEGGVGDLTAGQIGWLRESTEGQQLVDQALTELLGKDEDE